mgnify:CR=1 FL=1
MNKTKFKSFQFACLTIFPILSLFAGIGTHNIIEIAALDSYMSPIIAGVLGIIILLMFIYIFNYEPNKTIIEKNIHLFGNILGTIINYIISILFLLIGITLLYNISNFAISQFLAETPLLIFMIVLGIILIYNVSLGIENISRVGIIFFGIIIFLTLISTIGTLPTIDLNNIKPILEYGLDKPIYGGIFLILGDIVPLFTLLIVKKDYLIDKQKSTKYITIFYILAIILISIAMFLTISSLGIYLSSAYQYPEYTVLKKITLFGFIDRIENFIYIKWILSTIMYLSLIIYYVSYNINKNSKKLVPTILVSIIIFISLYLFKNNTIFYNFTSNIYPYIGLLLLIIFTIITINIFARKLISK